MQIYENRDIAKKCILNHLIKNCIKEITSKEYIDGYKEQLISLYNYKEVTIESILYKVQKLEITKSIEFPRIKNKLIIKCRNMSYKDLNKKISMLSLQPLYN